MSGPSLQETEREQIEMLLPWYVTGKLDPDDLAKVEAYLAAHPQLARQLDLARAEHEQVVTANEALVPPAADAVARLMAALPAATPVQTAWRVLRHGFGQVGTLFVAPTANAVRWAAVAVAALVAIETTVLLTLVSERTGTYRTASGVEAGDGISVLVMFADDAKATAVSQLLADFNGSIVDGPRAGGVYKVRLRTEDRSQAAREALVARLAERRDLVRGVLPSRD